jgi:NADH-quinone oxidoreductase subunit M
MGRSIRRLLRAALAVAAFIAVACIATPGRAEGAGRLVLSLPDGSAGPLVLASDRGKWVGTFTITNLGDGPLTVSRLALWGDDEDVRSPSRVTVRFADGAPTSATLAPGAARDAVVTWAPDRSSSVRQAFGHVIVTSTDESRGEVAMGFRAQTPTGLGWIGEHALSMLVLLPLVLLPLVWAVGAAGLGEHRLVPVAALGLACTRLALALWAYQRFVPSAGRAEGNDGFQLVERTVWVRSAGSEWFLGVDGTSIVLVVLCAVLGLLATVVAVAEGRGGAQHAALALATSALLGALTALDLVLLLVCGCLLLLSLAVLVGGHGGYGSARAAARLAVHGAIGGAAMALVVVLLAGASDPTYLVDGSAAPHTLAIPELARTSFAARPPIAGIPFLEAVWALLLVAAVVSSAGLPLHGWLPDALERGPLAAGILAAGVTVALGPYLLVRIGMGGVPEGARWLGPSIATLGAIGCGWGALGAFAQFDLRRFVAYSTIASGGVCLFGVGSLSARGVAGAITTCFAHGLGAGMLLALTAALEQRVRTCDLRRLGGLAKDAPALYAMAGVSIAASAALPGMVGGWGALLALLGGFAPHPVLGAVLAAAGVISILAHGRLAAKLFFGAADPVWKASELLAPFGGRVPDARPVELAVLVPVATIALLLGLWPAPLLSTLSGAARDAADAVATVGAE